MTLSRRAMLGAGAALTAAGVAGGVPETRGAAPAAGRQVPGIYRYKIGSFELTALNDGFWKRPVQEGFIANASVAEIKEALAAAFLPPEEITTPATTLLVNTGARLVLIDAGTGGKLAPTAGMLIENMEAAGIDPKAVDTVVISHFHGDHILGLRTKAGEPVFPNAQVKVPEAEWAFWMDEGQMSRAPENLKRNFQNARQTFDGMKPTRYPAGKEVAPGITAVAAPGHTPGHTAYRIASGGEQMLLLSDTTSVPALFVAHPGWQAAFDMDPRQAEATRRRLLDMAATDRIRVAGYHFPFPATGHIARKGEGYAFVPTAWTAAL